ncbi:MAG: M23 family metallopeptidase [Caldilineales bacterium]
MGRPTATPWGLLQPQHHLPFSGGIHFGIDLSAPCGTEIVAIADGVVAGGRHGLRLALPHNLIIDHPQLGYATLCGHLLERPNLTPGQEVKQGQVVALSGDPEETCFGRPHLHLEIRDYPGAAGSTTRSI